MDIERWNEIKDLPILNGAHKANKERQMCVLEMVAFVADERWSDNPKCVSPVIGSFMRSWNDCLNDEDRQRLKPYIEKVIGTNTGAEDDERRAWMATDWLCRVCAPAFLELTESLKTHAASLRSLEEIRDSGSAKASQGDLAAAWAAAGAAARDAAWAAARDAAWAAAGDAAWAAAGDAAWAAAGDALLPTVAALQVSACDLADRMILLTDADL